MTEEDVELRSDIARRLGPAAFPGDRARLVEVAGTTPQVSQMPSGGANAGGGSTAGSTDDGLVAAGGGLLLAADVVLLRRRRPSVTARR